jgi:hypothetical protein
MNGRERIRAPPRRPHGEADFIGRRCANNTNGCDRCTSMRRVLRYVLRFLGAALVALSVAAFVAVAFAWLRSYWFGDVFERTTVSQTSSGLCSNDLVRVLSARGVVVVSGVRRDEQRHGPSHVINRKTSAMELEPWPPRPFQFVEQKRSTTDPDQVNLLRKTLAQKLGFNLRRASYPGLQYGATERVSDWAVRAPHWALMLVTVFPPLLGWRLVLRGLRRRRWRRGVCGRCGYDLRASEARCPECGTSIPPKAPGPSA